MLRLPKELRTALRHLSIDRGVSLNAIITELLEQWWAEQPEYGKYPPKSVVAEGARASRGRRP